MVRIASSSHGFSCGLKVVDKSVSVYHDKSTLLKFRIEKYVKGDKEYSDNRDGVPFQIGHMNLEDFYNTLNATYHSTELPDLVESCYGGVFATTTANIFKQNMTVWKTLEASTKRGDNIQEGHYAERSWGLLLANPLKQHQIDALYKHANRVRTWHEGPQGPLQLLLNCGDRKAKKSKKRMCIESTELSELRPTD